MREILAFCRLRELLSITRLTYIALSSIVDCITAIQFDSDSYPIRINTHASCCMVNAPHLFEDLKLGDVGGGRRHKSRVRYQRHGNIQVQN